MSYLTSRIKRFPFHVSEVWFYLTIQSKTAERPLEALAALGGGFLAQAPEWRIQEASQCGEMGSLFELPLIFRETLIK